VRRLKAFPVYATCASPRHSHNGTSPGNDKIDRMTLARTERSDNVALALKSMLERVADTALDEVSFSPAAHPDILTTTWDELLATELIETLPSGEYILAGRGWTAAVISTGLINDPVFRQRIEKLFGTAKGFVKGRKDSATVPFSELVTQTGLPDGFVFNVIQGKYMEEVSKRARRFLGEAGPSGSDTRCVWYSANGLAHFARPRRDSENRGVGGRTRRYARRLEPLSLPALQCRDDGFRRISYRRA
jgi:hypothetical protein